MSKILIIGDIHHKWERAEELIDKHRPEQIVFVGDYFDSYHDSPEDMIATGTWLEHSLSQPNRIHCWGNHDISYYAPQCSALYSPGFTLDKSEALNSCFAKENWSKLKLCHVIRGKTSDPAWLVSHAGFHPAVITVMPSKSTMLDNIVLDSRVALMELKNDEDQHVFFQSGSRMNGSGVGGPLWLDWHEFTPLNGINQIVGHTAFKTIQTKHSSKSLNYNIDCHLDYALLLEDGVCSIVK